MFENFYIFSSLNKKIMEYYNISEFRIENEIKSRAKI